MIDGAGGNITISGDAASYAGHGCDVAFHGFQLGQGDIRGLERGQLQIYARGRGYLVSKTGMTFRDVSYTRPRLVLCVTYPTAGFSNCATPL